LRISAPAHAPNTDAIDPIDSRHVLIVNNTISVGDDVVAIKSSGPDARYPDAVSSDIEISGNTVLAGRGICIGSGTSGGVRRVRVENNRFEGSMYGLRIKSMRGKGGMVRDVTFSNNRMQDVETPLVVTAYYEYRPLDPQEAQKQLQPGGFLLGNQIWPGPDDTARGVVHDQTPDIADITVDGLVATGAEQAGIIVGLPEQAIRRFSIKNVSIEAKRGLLVRHAELTTQAVKIDAETGPPLLMERAGRVLSQR